MFAKPILSENEIEFLAEHAMIQIMPRFSSDELELVSGSFGPFIANVPISVPLWLALHLKRSKQCQIIVPEWLSLGESLRHIIIIIIIPHNID